MADVEDDTEEKPVITADAAPAATVDLRQPVAPPVAPAAAPAPSLDDMIVTPEQQKTLQDRLVAIKRAQMSSNAAGASSVISQLHKDRAQMDEAYKATALPAEDLKPWDTQAKQREYTTDPVTAFGSIGSVFAMLAPAFVGLPMEYSLQAGAAAINAIHDADDKAYERDYAAWKDNTQLALKRHDIMRQAYNDSILKMNTDLNAGRSEMEMNARKFGDQQALTLLEAGLDGDLNKLINDRNKTALELQNTSDKVWLEHEKVQDLRNDPNFHSPNEGLKQKAIQDWQDRWKAGGRSQLAYDAEADFVKKYKDENPDWTSQSLKEAITGFRQETDAKAGGTPASLAGMQAQEIQRRAKEYVETEKMDPAAAFDRATREVRTAVSAKDAKPEGGKLTGPQMKERERQMYADKVRAEHPDWDDTKVLEESRRLQQVGSPPPLTSAQANRLQDRTFLADYTLGKIDTQIERLQHRSGLTGLGGVVTRGKERIGNLFGSNEVEAQEFYKDLEEMKLNAARMLTLSQGRPLATEAARINAVLKGNQIGDLTAPTLAAMRDYQEFVKKFKADAATRLQGNPTPSQTSPNEPTGRSGAKKRPWESDPIISPRSELTGEQAVL